MDILDIYILKGPNYWSIHHKVAELVLDIGKYEDLPTNKINGFYEILTHLLPGLSEHKCSEEQHTGFLERVKEGTRMGHVTEHVAIELQSMAGMKVAFGKTVSQNNRGIYKIVFAYEEERAAIYAAHAAVRLVESICEGKDYPLNEDIAALEKIAAEDKLGPSTLAIVKSAQARNIPVIRLNKGSLVQLGYGNAQQRIEGTITDHTSNIAVQLACDKYRTKLQLKEAGIAVPEGFLITQSSELAAVIKTLGFPLVIKPNNGSQGKGVTVNILSSDRAMNGFERANKISDEILVERFHPGRDYRLLVVNYKFVAAALRTPAMVTGDGKLNLRQLIDVVNLDPTRGDDHENIRTKIRADSLTDEFLRFQDLSLDDIPASGKNIYLRETANLSTGGTAEDVTDLIHPEIIAMAERVARIIGLDICGIDFISEDISFPLKMKKGVVIEVNAAPGLSMHTHPSKGKPRNVGESVIDMLFPRKNNGRIPLIAITGTNGKTTTTRLIAHLAKTAGYNVGFTTSDGIYVGNDLIEEGDCTDPVSASKLLRDKSINFAVLECARDGLLHSGLAFDHCDIGIVTNVAEDHLGLNGIVTLEDMARVKSVIPESVKPGGVAILNADYPLSVGMKQQLKCKIALYSTKMCNEVLDHCKKGGVAAVYKDRKILLIKGNTIFFSENIYNIPLAFGGKAIFMIENILAAVLAAFLQGIDIENIGKGLHSFVPSFENVPGRMNLIRFKNFKFLLDYAHNSHGIYSLGSWIRQERCSYKIGIITSPGDRRDVDIMNVGKASAEIFDKIIIRVDEDTRGRTEDEIIDLLYAGIKDISKNLPVEIIKNEIDAIASTLMNAVPGSLIVHFSDNITRSFELIKKYKQKEEEFIDESEYKNH